MQVQTPFAFGVGALAFDALTVELEIMPWLGIGQLSVFHLLRLGALSDHSLEPVGFCFENKLDQLVCLHL